MGIDLTSEVTPKRSAPDAEVASLAIVFWRQAEFSIVTISSNT
jgi:hypothetical protein